MFEVKKVKDLELAFGPMDINNLLPKYEDIPEVFRDSNNKWNKIISTWFFFGLKNVDAKPKKGIDTKEALRHIQAVLRSFEPSHERKEYGCAYLLSLWFDDFKCEPASKKFMSKRNIKC